MLALQTAGFAILEPFGENTRYDLVIEDGTRLIKVQCKSGRLRGGTVRFPTCSCYGHHRHPDRVRRSYHGEADLFGVYCPETGAVYLVPVADCGHVQTTLRVTPAANNQSAGIRWAADYEVARVTVEVVNRRRCASLASAF